SLAPQLGESPASGQTVTPKAVLSFDKECFADMPVWVGVKMPEGEIFSRMQANIRYPFSSEPWCFGLLNDFEVRRDGKPLPKRWASAADCSVWNGPPAGSCAPPSSPKGRFPLHLKYRFDRPGTYLVRFLGYSETDYTHKSPAVVSEWTTLVIKS